MRCQISGIASDKFFPPVQFSWKKSFCSNGLYRKLRFFSSSIHEVVVQNWNSCQKMNDGFSCLFFLLVTEQHLLIMTHAFRHLFQCKFQNKKHSLMSISPILTHCIPSLWKFLLRKFRNLLTYFWVVCKMNVREAPLEFVSCHCISNGWIEPIPVITPITSHHQHDR